MAMITDTVAGHFDTRDNLHDICLGLDAGLYSVGLSVRMLRDMAVHGSPGTASAECDTEELAAMAEGALAHIGYLAELIDKLENQTNPYRVAQRATSCAATDGSLYPIGAGAATE